MDAVEKVLAGLAPSTFSVEMMATEMSAVSRLAVHSCAKIKASHVRRWRGRVVAMYRVASLMSALQQRFGITTLTGWARNEAASSHHRAHSDGCRPCQDLHMAVRV